MKATRLLCVAAMLACSGFGVWTMIQENRMPRISLEPVREQLAAIDDREELMKRVDLLLLTLEKADDRIHDWRRLTIRAWFSAAFMFLMVLIGSFAWNRKPTPEDRCRDLQDELFDE